MTNLIRVIQAAIPIPSQGVSGILAGPSEDTNIEDSGFGNRSADRVLPPISPGQAAQIVELIRPRLFRSEVLREHRGTRSKSDRLCASIVGRLRMSRGRGGTRLHRIGGRSLGVVRHREGRSARSRHAIG